MKKIEDYFVPWLKGQKMYVSTHIDLAWKRPELHRMMSNENPLPPSKKVVEAILQYAEIANRYPDQGFAVRQRLADINGLDGIENVLLGNGSSEVYDMLWRAFVAPGEEIVQHSPCFGIYKLRGAVVGAKMVSVPMIYKDRKLLFDADGIVKAITPMTKAIVVANPNNPTGNFMDDADFAKIAETGVPFVVDEAYVEYSGLGRSQVKLVKRFKNVIITRTLSKAYGLAGMRFGYALGDKDVIMQIAATLIPWNVSTIAMWAALAALQDTAGLHERVEFNNQEIEYIETELAKVPGITVFHSHANYILFDSCVPGKTGKGMVDYAEQKGLILRSQEPMYGSEGWFRVTIGSHEENTMFVQAVREYFAP